MDAKYLCAREKMWLAYCRERDSIISNAKPVAKPVHISKEEFWEGFAELEE